MRNTNKQIRKLTFACVLTAASLILSYVEAVLPPIFPAIPGIKVGLHNIVIVFLLYSADFPTALSVSLVRITLASLLFGNPIALVYSAAGALLSLSVMAILKRLNFLSIVGVSVAGGISHNLGQILAAMLLLETAAIGYYMTVLAIAGTLAGLFVGICGAMLTKRFLRI